MSKDNLMHGTASATLRGTDPDTLVRVDQLLHDSHDGITAELDVDRIRFVADAGQGSTWNITVRGASDVGIYTAGDEDNGWYVRVGAICYCRFRLNGTFTSSVPGDINLISLPFTAIIPPLNANNVPLSIGTGVNANDEYLVRLEASMPAGYAIYEPNNGSRSFDDYGHFWYFVE